MEIEYIKIMRNSKDPKQIRLPMVKHAIKLGIKPTARVFMTTPKTVGKWVKRYEQGGYRALDEASTAPHHPANQVTPEQYEEVLRLN
jgi:transposase-like protein